MSPKTVKIRFKKHKVSLENKFSNENVILVSCLSILIVSIQEYLSKIVFEGPWLASCMLLWTDRGKDQI